MNNLNNNDRAQRAQHVIATYGDDVNESNLIDFLADAMHLCHENDEDFERCLRLARTHFEAETSARTTPLVHSPHPPIFPNREHKIFDIDEQLERRHEIAIIWSVEDVQSLRPDLDDDESWKVLNRCREAHDCNHGINWGLIEMVASDLFPEPHEGERP